MFIDTHCHLTDEYLKGDNLDAIVSRARDAGVGVLICPTADPSDIPNAMDIVSKYENIFCTIGIHPEYAKDYIGTADKFLTPDVLNNPKTIGIGEIGLDYHYGAEFKKQQIELFEQQLEIARAHALPVAIHTREAEADTAAILTGNITGVMHCFTSSWDLAKIMLDRGFFFSASGIVTFKNSHELRETFAKIPTDRIVIETDAPWCAPVPYRGQECEPAMVTEVAKVLAQIKNLQLNELEIILEQNTKKLYPKMKI